MTYFWFCFSFSSLYQVLVSGCFLFKLENLKPAHRLVWYPVTWGLPAMASERSEKHRQTELRKVSLELVFGHRLLVQGVRAQCLFLSILPAVLEKLGVRPVWIWFVTG